MTQDGDIYLQDTLIEGDELITKLEAIAGNGYDEGVYLRGDKNTDYGQVVKVMARINNAGFTNIKLVNEPLE